MNLVTLVHVVGGTVALASGLMAAVFRKGGRGHALAGTVFVVSMLVLGLTAAVIAPLESPPDPLSAITGLFICYLVGTAWAAARFRVRRAGPIELAGLALGVGCAIAFFAFGAAAARSPTGTLGGFGPTPFYINSALAGLAALLDLNYLIRSRIGGLQRISRHLWRMCIALLMAASAFFLGQQKVMPEMVRGSLWLFVPALAALPLMIFWLVRLRFTKRIRQGVRNAAVWLDRIRDTGAPEAGN